MRINNILKQTGVICGINIFNTTYDNDTHIDDKEMLSDKKTIEIFSENKDIVIDERPNTLNKLNF